MTEELTVRVGTLEDLDDMMELAFSACDENGFVSPEPEKLLREIYASLSLNNGMIGIIGKKGQKPEGAILLSIVSPWYSGKKLLEEKGIFIHPDYRSAKGGRARCLCEFAKKVADSLEIPLLIGVLSNHRTAGKIKMYERQFGQPSGAFFLYGANTGDWK